MEPRLSHVFGGESAAAEWLGRRFTLPAPWILAATKLGSVTNRAMGHKKVKDVSDLYAVLEYSEPGFDRIRQKVLENVGADMVASTVASLGDDDYEGASDVCGVEKGEISKSVRALAP